MMKIMVMKGIMDANKNLALENRMFFKANNINAINIMASPGAGKTSIILKIIENLIKETNIFVIEGDIASSIDSMKINKTGANVIQINTAGGCHLDANMIKTAIKKLNVKKDSLILIENVGNLVCPSTFDLGENTKMLIASIPEGHDKPFKYTSMFMTADIIILNKMDLMPYIDFDKDSFYKGIKAINKNATIIEVSCTTNEGIDKLIEFIRQRR